VVIADTSVWIPFFNRPESYANKYGVDEAQLKEVMTRIA